MVRRRGLTCKRIRVWPGDINWSSAHLTANVLLLPFLTATAVTVGGAIVTLSFTSSISKISIETDIKVNQGLHKMKNKKKEGEEETQGDLRFQGSKVFNGPN
jgi:hypothetical protein